MKKYVFILLLAVMFMALTPANAQPDFGVGVKAGINISNQVTTGAGENVNLKSIVRFHGGAYFNYFFTEKFAIQPELLISGEGSDWNDPAYDVKDLLTYIDVPLLIRYQVIDLVNVHAGGHFGYLLKANQKDNATGTVTGINDYYKKPDVGLVFGAEANLPLKINVTVRYVLGLIGTTTDVEYIDPWLNNFFQISVGYRFLGK